MPANFRFLIAQIPSQLGDIQSNLNHIKQQLQLGKQQQADLVVFSEMALTGYALQDRLFYPTLEQQLQPAIEQLCELSTICPFIVGMPLLSQGDIFNGCAFFNQGQLQWQYAKQFLAQNQIFDEARYFTPGNNQPTLTFRGIRIALALGDEPSQPDFLNQLTQQPDVLLNLSADLFYLNRTQERERNLAKAAQQLGCPLVFINTVGAQDEWIYAGQSSVFNAQGQLLQRAAAFVPSNLELNLAEQQQPLNNHLPSEEALVYQALVTSLREYVASCGFKGVLLGLSGGIDSALVLAIAVDALGADKVTAVMMPYHYTAQISQDDAAEQANCMGVTYHILPIIDIVQQFSQQLEPLLNQWPASAQDTTEQNLQARSRGSLLMALSNRSGALLLTTSNKSEMAVGYCTLYGDMAGGFAPLKDVPKTLVYRLAHYRNSLSAVIPERVITRPPTAELAPDQSDTDNLPPYPVLDEIIRLYVEENQSSAQIIAQGLDAATVNRIVRLINLSEYKRRQAAMGPKITKRGFGRERRMPVAIKPS